MALLTVQTPSLSGVEPTFAAATATTGDTFANSGREVLYVKNGAGVSTDVTIDSVTACDQGFDHDIVVTVLAGDEAIIGPFPTGRFNDGGGLVEVICDPVATVTIAAIRAY
jgi:hypothetical protein